MSSLDTELLVYSKLSGRVLASYGMAGSGQLETGSASFIWILYSTVSPQPLSVRGVWIDSGIWNSAGVWYE